MSEADIFTLLCYLSYLSGILLGVAGLYMENRIVTWIGGVLCGIGVLLSWV